jgi:hypothetical protein
VPGCSDLRRRQFACDDAASVAEGGLAPKVSDRALRHVYPLCDYGVECASDLRNLLVTLAANGGFDITFAISLETAAAIARDLVVNGRLLIEAQPSLPL